MMTGTIISSILVLMVAMAVYYPTDNDLVTLSGNIKYIGPDDISGGNSSYTGGRLDLVFSRPAINRTGQTGNMTSMDRPKVKQPDMDIPFNEHFRMVAESFDYPGDAADLAFLHDPGTDNEFDEYTNRRETSPSALIPTYRLDFKFRGSASSVDRPLYIEFRGRIDYPFNGTGLIDTVLVILTIDDNGFIQNIETIYDNWPTCGFAPRFKAALHDAYIRPEIRNGCEVGGSYLLFCIFDKNRASTEIRNSQDVHIRVGS